MDQPITILNKKTVAKVVRRAIENAKGEWTAEDIKAAAKSSFTPTEKDLNFLYEALIASAFDSVVSTLAGPAKHGDNGQVDWIGYSETVIRLGEKRFVKMVDASSEHLEVRRRHVSDNALEVTASAHGETKRIDIINKEMKDKQLKTAGEAMVSLGYIAAPDKQAAVF